ncbi:Molybdenum cofactor sulfurase [Cercospora zeina]
MRTEDRRKEYSAADVDDGHRPWIGDLRVSRCNRLSASTTLTPPLPSTDPTLFAKRMAAPSQLEAYDAYIEDMRKTEYPMLEDGALYLDHAGTTLYSKTHLDRFRADMLAHLYGNPHSASPSSQRSTLEIETVRHEVLTLFDADPDVFDLVLTANATAAIKLVVEALREQQGGFWFGYHAESHTSLVGVRELAKEHCCFESDEAVESWLRGDATHHGTRLFAYPAQSNMNGRKVSRNWVGECRTQSTYSLLDAAACAATSPLRLSDANCAPDFTVLSFTKMFGFPDLGALIVKKDCSHLFQHRKYFGGGTVDMVVCLKEQWHASKTDSLHEQLEDGTLPVHSILALKSAMQTHRQLYRSLDRTVEHTTALSKQLYDGLVAFRHANGRTVCRVYKHSKSSYGDANTQGPTIAFNLQDGNGRWVSNTEVEKLAAIKNIHLRTGGLCNPGGVATGLDLAPWEMHESFSAGFRCGSDNDVMNGKPTGMLRVSLGAMSTRSDVTRFLDFVGEFFVDPTPATASLPPSPMPLSAGSGPRFCVESLTVYPIKSCSGWQVPYDTSWDVRREGLAWDREWCIVNQTTGAALSQKAYPRMALIRPQLDLKSGVLRITQASTVEEITVPLSKDPRHFEARHKVGSASVCGDRVQARLYTSPAISDFFTKCLGVPCTLARFPAATLTSPSVRHSKAHLQMSKPNAELPRPILLSNESPILTISRSSLNRLNEIIKAKGESPLLSPGQEQPYAEDLWASMSISDADSKVEFEFLGGCRRCQMVCIDQKSGEKNQEPFVTLAKTRRVDGRVLFGVHTSLAEGTGGVASGQATIRVADAVTMR